MKYRLSIELLQQDRRGETAGGLAVHARTLKGIKVAADKAISALATECEAEFKRRVQRRRKRR